MLLILDNQSPVNHLPTLAISSLICLFLFVLFVHYILLLRRTGNSINTRFLHLMQTLCIKDCLNTMDMLAVFLQPSPDSKLLPGALKFHSLIFHSHFWVVS